MRRRRSPVQAVALSLLAVVAMVAAAPAAASGAGPGTRETLSYPGGYRAIQYTPASLDRTRPAPLLVMVHGCGTTAEQQEAANGLDEQAERDGFVVLYPDHDQATLLHRIGCWNWETDTTRDSPDPAALAAMIRDALAQGAPAIDPDRVYVSGMSSGAMMTAILAATYPELLAAIHMNAGCAYRAVTCIVTGPTLPTASLARQAADAMGDRAHLLPVLVTQGDRDGTVSPLHSAQVLEQWRLTDNLIAGTMAASVPAAATRTRTDAPAGRYPSTVQQLDQPDGCVLLERWSIHGMDHFWPGGSTDPASAPFTDPKGPDGGDLAWTFFRRYRRQVGTRSPCVPATPPAARPCASRRIVTVTVPAGLTRVRVTLAGRRVAVRGHRVVADLRGRPRGTVRLVITGRARSGRPVRVVRSFKTCGA